MCDLTEKNRGGENAVFLLLSRKWKTVKSLTTSKPAVQRNQKQSCDLEGQWRWVILAGSDRMGE